ncbi:MAG: hypothetical protein ACFFKA_07940, partial [Candidatus Thorarchaeota archaeon]
MLYRVIGVDPGSKSWDFFGLENKEVILDTSIPSIELIEELFGYVHGLPTVCEKVSDFLVLNPRGIRHDKWLALPLKPQFTEQSFSVKSLNENIKTFFVYRDLRDSLVSLYFSFKYSHPILHDELQKHH